MCLQTGSTSCCGAPRTGLLLLLRVEKVKQPVLVKDILRVVQGLTGKYNCFRSAAADPAAPGSGLAVSPQDQLVLPSGLRTLLHELGELGLMYK